MNPMREKQARLVNALIKASQQGHLKWTPFSETLEGDSDSAFTEVNGKTISLSDIESQEGLQSIRLEIYQDQKKIDSFLDDDLVSSGIEPLGADYWYSSMSILLQNALRQSSGADEVIDDLLKSLGE